MVQSKRAGKSWRHFGRSAGVERPADRCRDHPTCEQYSRVRARLGRFLTGRSAGMRLPALTPEPRATPVPTRAHLGGSQTPTMANFATLSDLLSGCATRV